MMSGLSMLPSHIYYDVAQVLDSNQLENVCVDISDIGCCMC